MRCAETLLLSVQEASYGQSRSTGQLRELWGEGFSRKRQDAHREHYPREALLRNGDKAPQVQQYRQYNREMLRKGRQAHGLLKAPSPHRKQQARPKVYRRCTSALSTLHQVLKAQPR